MRDRIRIRGRVTVRVLEKDGTVKRRAPGWFRRLLRLRGRLMVYSHHNIVTREGDALIADALLGVQARPKVASSSGFIQVGSGWAGGDTKHTSRCNVAGVMRAIDAGYPALKGTWGNPGDTTVMYRATFEAGSLNVNGINEAALLNGSDATANCLAYAEISPVVNVTESDTLQVVWEITILGQ